jgi:hypothetical protein
VNRDELARRFPRCSQKFLDLNSEADFPIDGAGPLAQLERDPGHGAVAKVPVQKGTRRRFLVRITAIRKRLLDVDNCCEKYHVDLLRYASGGAFGDDPSQTQIEVGQIKAGQGEPEEVRIDVFEL